MKNRFPMLLVFLAAFMFTTPALAQPPGDDAKAEEKVDDGNADDAKADGTDAKAEEKSDAKAEEKADAKAEEKADGTDGTDTDAAPKEVETDEEAVAAAGELITAIQEKHWALALGLGLSLLVFGLRKVKVLAKVPKKALPWVTAVLGIVTYVAAALMTDGANVTDALWGGAMTGAAAVGLWEMVLKNFLGGSKDSDGGSGS